MKMSRPVFVFGICYTVCIAAAVSAGLRWLLWGGLAAFAIGGLLALLFHVMPKIKPYLYCAAAAFVLAVLVMWQYNAAIANVNATYQGQILPFEGVVTGVRTYAAGQSCELYGHLPRSGGTASVMVSAYSYEALDLRPGDYLKTTLAISGSRNSQGLGAFLSRGVTLYARMTGDEYETITPAAKDPVYYLVMLREQMAANIEAVTPAESAPLVQSILLSYTNDLPPTVWDNLYNSGIGHLLAVSGTHLTLIAMGVAGWLQKIKAKKRLQWLGGIVTIVLVVTMAGFSPSVLRAGIMLAIMFTGRLIDRQSDSLTSLAVSAVLLLTLCPGYIASSSFQYSFASALSIILFASLLEGWLTARLKARRPNRDKWMTRLLSLLALCLSVLVLTFPLTVFKGQTLPTYTLLTNLLVTPLVPAILFCGAVCGLLGGIPFLSGLLGVLGVIGGFGASLLATLAGVVCRLPYAVLPVREPYLFLWFALFLAVVFALYIRRPGFKTTRYALAALLLPLIAGILSHVLLTRNTLEVIIPLQSEDVILCRGNTAAVIESPGTPAGVEELQALLRNANVKQVDFILSSDPAPARLAADVVCIQTLAPAMAALPQDRCDEAAYYTSGATTLTPTDNGCFQALGAVTVTPGRRYAFLQMETPGGKITILKLSRGYGITFTQNPETPTNRAFPGFSVSNESLTLKLRQALRAFYECKFSRLHPCLYAPSSCRCTSYLPRLSRGDFGRYVGIHAGYVPCRELP